MMCNAKPPPSSSTITRIPPIMMSIRFVMFSLQMLCSRVVAFLARRPAPGERGTV
jgi:hypothetical protein